MSEILLVSRFFLKRPDGNILLVQRSPLRKRNPKKYEATGGKRILPEDSLQAGKRETHEEIGVWVTGFRGFFSTPHREIRDGPYAGYLHVVRFRVAIAWVGRFQLSDEHCWKLWVTYHGLFRQDITRETVLAARALKPFLL